jgi:8-oxo-dGTP pyrophosphatase MutT (NUDIX family)
MVDFVHEWEHEGEVIKFFWLGDAEVKPDRAYAFAFTTDRQMLLVTDAHTSPGCWLPGGGIEPGETPEQALVRELSEEANALMHASVKMGMQRAESSFGSTSFQAFYWCRITVNAEFSPTHEVTERVLVKPEEFLDRLFWGRIDPKGTMLLDRALQIEARHDSHNVPHND